MPGSSNFVGEFLILLGVFKAKLAIAVIAFARRRRRRRLRAAAVHQLDAQPRRADVTSREIGLADALAIVPLVLVILVLAFYPQFGLRRSEPSVRAAIAPAQAQSSASASSVNGGAAP